MATNRLIQKLFAHDESGVGEDSIAVSDRRQVEKFRVLAVGAGQTETVAAGDIVALKLDAGSDGEVAFSVSKAAADSHCIGVAISGGTSTTDSGSNVTAAPFIDVCISGIAEAQVEGANNAGNATVSAGDFLCQGDTAGVLYKYTAGTDAMPHAIAVDGQSSGATGLKTVIFLSQF